MQVDGRTLSHEMSETIRRMASERGNQELWSVPNDDLQVVASGASERARGTEGTQASGTQAGTVASTEAASSPMDQWEGSSAIRIRLWAVDAPDRGRVGSPKVRCGVGCDGDREIAVRAGHHAAKAAAPRLRARPRSHRAVDQGGIPGASGPRQAHRSGDLLPGRGGSSLRPGSRTHLGA